jgi:hypothetical protein
MNHIEILDRLFAVRRELLRLTIATASQAVSETALEQLLAYRDQVNVIVQGMIANNLAASVADLSKECATLDAFNTQLKSLAGTEADVLKAIDLTRSALNGLTPVLARLT